MSSYSYKVTRETTGPRGGSYTTSSYSSPTTYSPGRSYHSSYMTPSRTSRYVPPPRTTTYTSYVPSSSLPRSGDTSERVVKRVERVVETTSTAPRY